MPACILVVEKDALTRDTIVHMLESLNYTTIPTANVKLAYDILDAVRCNIVIASLELGDPDGVNIAMDAKAYQGKIKVIVVSGHYPPESLNGLIDAYVQKPFSLKQIDDAIKSVLAQAA